MDRSYHRTESFRTLPASRQLIGLCHTLLRPVAGLLESRACEVASALNHLEQRTSDKQAATRYVGSIYTSHMCCCCLVCQTSRGVLRHSRCKAEQKPTSWSVQRPESSCFLTQA